MSASNRSNCSVQFEGAVTKCEMSGLLKIYPPPPMTDDATMLPIRKEPSSERSVCLAWLSAEDGSASAEEGEKEVTRSTSQSLQSLS